MKIAVDIDDVIIDSGRPLIEYISRKLKRNIEYADITSYSLSTIYDIENDQMIEIIDEFQSSSSFRTLPPVEDSNIYLKKLSLAHDLILLSARTESLAEVTEDWLNNNIEVSFKDILLTGLYRRHNDDKVTKAEICIENDVDLFIEDAPHHALGAVKAGIPTILYERPWNISQKRVDNLFRVNSWKKVYDAVKKIEEND